MLNLLADTAVQAINHRLSLSARELNADAIYEDPMVVDWYTELRNDATLISQGYTCDVFRKHLVPNRETDLVLLQNGTHAWAIEAKLWHYRVGLTGKLLADWRGAVTCLQSARQRHPGSKAALAIWVAKRSSDQDRSIVEKKLALQNRASVERTCSAALWNGRACAHEFWIWEVA